MPTPTARTVNRIAVILQTDAGHLHNIISGIEAASRVQTVNGSSEQAPRLPWVIRLHRDGSRMPVDILERRLREWNPDGLICAMSPIGLVDICRRLGKPVVEVSNADTGFPRVTFDHLAIGDYAATYFLNRGFRSFAFFGDDRMIWSRERRTSFEKGIRAGFDQASRSTRISRRRREEQLEFSAYPHALALTEDTNEIGLERDAMGQVTAWLHSLPKPVALLAANDNWAMHVSQVAHEVGIKIPEQISLLGVDDDQLLCSLGYPPISSIRIGAEELGRQAVLLMDQLLAGEKPASRVVTVRPVGVVSRQSSEVWAVQDDDVAVALRHIREHALENLSVKELLDVVPVNRRTLEQRFTALLGRTPLEEIHRIRRERALELLRTNLSVSEVARYCGFSSAQYMARVLRKETGMSPSDYRQHFVMRREPLDHTAPAA